MRWFTRFRKKRLAERAQTVVDVPRGVFSDPSEARRERSDSTIKKEEGDDGRTGVADMLAEFRRYLGRLDGLDERIRRIEGAIGRRREDDAEATDESPEEVTEGTVDGARDVGGSSRVPTRPLAVASDSNPLLGCRRPSIGPTGIIGPSERTDDIRSTDVGTDEWCETCFVPLQRQQDYCDATHTSFVFFRCPRCQPNGSPELP